VYLTVNTLYRIDKEKTIFDLVYSIMCLFLSLFFYSSVECLQKVDCILRLYYISFHVALSASN